MFWLPHFDALPTTIYTSVLGKLGPTNRRATGIAVPSAQGGRQVCDVASDDAACLLFDLIFLPVRNTRSVHTQYEA